MGRARYNIGEGRVDISFQNEIYEVILKVIWGTVMISNFKFKSKGVNK